MSTSIIYFYLSSSSTTTSVSDATEPSVINYIYASTSSNGSFQQY